MAVTWAGGSWAASTPYAIGQRVINGAGVYVVRVPGTSGAVVGPTGTGTGILDGTVTWDFLGPPSAWSVVGVAPELSASPALTQVAALAATEKLDPTTMGEHFDEASAYLAAHIATLARNRGHGAVASETEGPFSRSYAMPRTPDLDLGLTSYGARFEEIIRLTVGIFGVVAFSP